MSESEHRVQRLREMLSTSFALKEVRVDIGESMQRLLTVRNVETLIDSITDEMFRVDERLPYWAELWHSAVALATFLHARSDLLHGIEAVDIGCGLGLTGIVAASRGASMTFLDYDEHAVHVAELNFLLNNPELSASFLLHDFRDTAPRRWPLILGADVIYEKRFIEPLLRFLDEALEADGTILLAEPNRMIAAPFFEALQHAGFTYRRESCPAALHGRTTEVSIYEIRRRRNTAS
jgi:ETFB lysine methyltransferase